jgi:hypothetical protein
MTTQKLILVEKLCTTYDIEISFINELKNTGLLEVQTIEQTEYIHQDRLANLEKIIRLHQDLNINMEGIDVILNLLQKVEALQNEVNRLKNKQFLFES